MECCLLRKKNKGTFIRAKQYGGKNHSAVLKNSEVDKCLELYSLNIPSGDIADKPYIILIALLQAW